MRRLLSLVLALALLLGCAAAETAEPRNEDAQITSKNLPLYYQKADRIWREDFPVYFLDGVEDLPLINLADWADFMVYLYNESDNNGENVYSLTCEVNEEEKWVKLTRETGSSAVFDFSQGSIAFDDYIAFLTPQNCSYMEVSGIPKTKNGEPFLIQYTRSRILYGEVTAVNLKEYEIPMAAQDGKYLLPLQTLSAFTIADLGQSVYYNGLGLFASPIQSMTSPTNAFQTILFMYGLLTDELIQKARAASSDMDEQFNFLLEEVSKASEMGKALVDQYRTEAETSIYNLYRSATPAPRSEALIKFGFSELALEMNCFYGLKSAHNIDNFITFFLQNEIGANLVDPDAAKADQAIADLTNFWLDDGHSAYLSASYLSDSGAANKLGFGNAARGSAGSMLSAFRAQYPEASQPYYEVGDTAYVTLDSFAVTADDDGVADYYALAKEGNLPNDTIGLICNAHKQITRENSPIKNVVLDLSCNGGGMAPAAFYTLGWFLGDANYSYLNTFTGAQAVQYFNVDVNLDHQFDENDTLAGRGLKLYCLISPQSFSCGNLVPWVFKENGSVTLLGRTSGGGSCVVGFDTTAWGTSFRYSSAKRLSFVKNGSFYDVDQGVEPDYFINDYANFYNREALTEFINGLF